MIGHARAIRRVDPVAVVEVDLRSGRVAPLPLAGLGQTIWSENSSYAVIASTASGSTAATSCSFQGPGPT